MLEQDLQLHQFAPGFEFEFENGEFVTLGLRQKGNLAVENAFVLHSEAA